MTPKKPQKLCNLKWLAPLFSAIIFLALLIFVTHGEPKAFDQPIADFAQNLRSPILTQLFRLITEAGDKIVIILLLIPALLAPKTHKTRLLILVNIAGAVILNQVFKFLVGRPRPSEALHLVVEDGFSFPSGHSMLAMSFYLLLIILAIQYFHKKSQQIAIALAGAILILLVGFSRIYLGVHFATDVLAGFALAFTWTSALALFAAECKNKQAKKAKRK